MFFDRELQQSKKLNGCKKEWEDEYDKNIPINLVGNAVKQLEQPSNKRIDKNECCYVFREFASSKDHHSSVIVGAKPGVQKCKRPH